jgi:predicted DNA-binding transcriptional regulator YafY
MNVSRIYRLLRLVTLLQSGRGYTANELADELQVSRRTVFRDLNALELAHIPYYYDTVRKGFQINRNFFLQPVNLTLAEALAILALAGRVRGKTHIPLLKHATHAAAKIENILPKTIREHVGSILSNLSMNLGPMTRHGGSDKYFDMLNGAILRRCVCKMEYESFYEQKRIRLQVHPLRLVFMQRAWYLLAWSVQEKQIRTYKLIRIHSLQVQDKQFNRSHDVQLDEHFGKAWSMMPEGKVYKIHIHFEPKVAGNVAEVLWHDTQRVEWNDDRSIEFHAEVDGLNEISWWILGYGDQAKVISPQPLAGRIAAVAGAVVKKYGKEGE